MFRRSAAVLALVLAATLLRASPQPPTAVLRRPRRPAHEHDAASHDASQPGGWTLPADAQQKKSPLTADAKVLEVGKSIFKNKCQKCHGPRGSVTGPTLIRITQRTWI